MADKLENRVQRLELTFDEYRAMFYRWLDEQRQDMQAFRKENERAHRDHEVLMGKLVETQGMILHLMNKMDEKLDNHEDRLNSAGL